MRIRQARIISLVRRRRDGLNDRGRALLTSTSEGDGGFYFTDGLLADVLASGRR